MKKPLIPFKLIPGSWGLKGKTFEKAKAEYELTGDDLKVKLAEIEFGVDSKQAKLARLDREYYLGNIPVYEHNVEYAKLSNENELEKFKALLVVDLTFKKIDQYEYDKKIIELETVSDSKEQKIALVTNEHKHNKIDDTEFEKQLATINGEPWVKVIKISMDPKNPSTLGEAELDWNEVFIKKLRDAGHSGPSEYVIVDNWFTMFCAAIANDTGLVNSTDNYPGFDKEEPDLDGNIRKTYK